VSRAWTVQWYGFRFCRRISFIASDTYGADRTRSLGFFYCLDSMEHDLAHGGFLSTFQKKIPGLLVCNARKWEQSHQTAINFLSDSRLGPILLLEWKRQGLCHGGANLVDLTFLKNYTKNKEVSRAWTVQWYGFRLCRCISFITSDTYGADGAWFLAFCSCLVSTEHDLDHGGFPPAFQQNFLGLLVCNAQKWEQSRKTAINFPSDGRLGPVFLLEQKWQGLCHGRKI